ncbi:MAG: chemotaxis protein CheD [Clostridium sp.]
MNMGDVRVGIADLNIVKPPKRIMTVGLGSCIGIAIYDKMNKVAGLSHIMLPDSSQFKTVENKMKFADLAIPMLIELMQKNGGNKRYFTAKIVGGASMFSFSDKNLVSDIGKRNGEAVKAKLAREGIPIVGEHIGGNKGRTMVFDPQNGDVIIRIVGQGEVQL